MVSEHLLCSAIRKKEEEEEVSFFKTQWLWVNVTECCDSQFHLFDLQSFWQSVISIIA